MLFPRVNACKILVSCWMEFKRTGARGSYLMGRGDFEQKNADMIIKPWNSARNMAELWSLCSPIDGIIDYISPLIQCAPLAVSCI